MRVLLLTEGTYPFVDGGVSTWCTQVVSGMPWVRFVVYAITGDVTARVRYDLPPGTDLVQVPLWGVEHPAEWGLEAGDAVGTTRRRLRTRGSLAWRFSDDFAAFLADLERPDADPIGAGRRLLALHRFFLEHDFAAALRAPQTC